MHAPLFDRAAFAARVGHDAETFRELVELFLEVEPARMDGLARAVAAGTADDIRIQAHAVAGSFRNMSLDALGDHAKTIERAAGEDDLAAVHAAHVELAEMFTRALAELAAARDGAMEAAS